MGNYVNLKFVEEASWQRSFWMVVWMKILMGERASWKACGEKLIDCSCLWREVEYLWCQVGTI